VSRQLPPHASHATTPATAGSFPPRSATSRDGQASPLATALAEQGTAGRGRRRGSPVTASDYVAERIREGIGKGVFPLGSRLDQQVLAEQMGVSIIPVREALRRLQSDGLVQIFPRRGAFVAELTAAELTEIGWIRERLEELALRLAAPYLTPAKLDKLDKQAERMMQLALSARPEQWFELNREWHFIIYDTGKTWVLNDMIRTLWARSRPYRVGRMAHPENRLNAVAEHREIIGYLRQGDINRAARGVRHHIRNASRRNLADASFRAGDPGTLLGGNGGEEG
jgi:DNA-binding GntR family transcriptional regulator